MKTAPMGVCSGQSPVAKMLQGCSVIKDVNMIMALHPPTFDFRKEIL